MTPRGTSPYFWSTSEEKALRPYLRGLAKGKYRDAAVAARAFMAEVPHVPPTRSSKAVKTHIIDAARKQGVQWAGVDWSRPELQAIKRYARAAVAGRFPTVADAAKACLRELDRQSRARRVHGLGSLVASSPRSISSLHDRMLREAHALGWPGGLGPWTAAEKAVLKRYLHELLRGRYRFVHEAADACAREMEELSRSRKPGRNQAGAIHPRSAYTVRNRLQLEAKHTAVPRFRSQMTTEEGALVEQYARLVDRGEYGTWKAAAKACRDEMLRRSEAAARSRGLHIRGFAGHSLQTIHVRMLELSRSLGLRGPRRVLWTEPELRRCESWVRWLVRHRAGRRRMHILIEAVEGLQEELARIGCVRTLSACQHRLYRSQRDGT